ncbi:DNA alkylation repair protein [Fibrisoma montanum]|uniref:DNA alkylation repair protein n=1 Tax=Fibrisoma montanum TaxID=2305895 RepID=A0A418MIQ0_9BACT|nr:DNA alkylation repair protein [Fibrisoma montanum]RIV27294.1 DNA alkylation repair protein [Fibrisoma montanum]
MTADQVKEALLALEQPERASFVARYFKTRPGEYGAGDQFLGLSMPQQHALARQYVALPIEETEKLVQDPFHECRMVGLLIWVNQTRRARHVQQQQILDAYLANRLFVNNWDLVDSSCPAIVGETLFTQERSVLYDLVCEDHLWSQRIAMVATLAFIRNGQFADTFALAERLLGHTHDLIHKATGWMLREVGKRNPDALDEFLHDHIRQLPRTALRYAIERYEPARRRYYLAL